MIEFLLLGVILVSCALALSLLIWFKTEAVPEWAKLFWMKGLFQLDKFREEKINAAPNALSYPAFLKLQNPKGFLTKIISCPICLTVWLTLFFEMFLTLGVILAGQAYILLLWGPLLLFIASGPAICILTLIIFATVVRLMNLNENKHSR